RPASNPSAFNRRCSARTSSPRRNGCRRYNVRSPSPNPASTNSPHVSGPTIPSTNNARPCWNHRTAFTVEVPNDPPSSEASIDAPSETSRCCTSSTSSPLSPARMVLIGGKEYRQGERELTGGRRALRSWYGGVQGAEQSPSAPSPFCFCL